MQRLTFFAFMAMCLLAHQVFAADMEDYCQAPPFLSDTPRPNVMLMVDASGSMSEWAYMDAYTSTKVYEGYFDPTKDYLQDASGVYQELVTGCPKQCKVKISCQKSNSGSCDPKGTHGCKSNQWACCPLDQWEIPTDCGQKSGNYLNWRWMTRIDLLRWSMTGGKPLSCSQDSIDKCDVGTWDPAKPTQLTCDLVGYKGCTLQSYHDIKVKARWDRLVEDQGGLLYQFKRDLSVTPRVGAMFYRGPYDGSEYDVVIDTVRLADFTDSANYDALNPYKTVITALNFQTVGGGTPTGPALWAAHAYLSQNDSVFGSPNPASGGQEWKDPMYQCIDFNDDGNCTGATELVQVACAKNFMILLSDGLWNLGGKTSNPVPVTHSIDRGFEEKSADPVVPAYWLHKKGFVNAHTKVATNIEALYTLGLWLEEENEGARALKNVAMYGSFDRNNEWPTNTTGYPQTTCSLYDTYATFYDGKGSLCTPIPNSPLKDWDKDGDKNPDTYFLADDPFEIKERIMTIINDILRKATSGTAVSVLSSSEGSGANLIQALFYPKRSFSENSEVSWTSDLMSYWFYLDPYFANMQIREDTFREGPAVTSEDQQAYTLLDLKNDYITSFTFDLDQNKTIANRWEDTSGTGSILTATFKGKVPIEKSAAIWRAGLNLWSTDPATRTIYTSVDGKNLIDFTQENVSKLDVFLGAASDEAAKTTINYVRGYDNLKATGEYVAGKEICTAADGCTKVGRSRTIITGICSGQKSPCDSTADCPSGETCAQESHVWKMGDIVSSTPRIMGPSYLNKYNAPVPYGYNDHTYSDFILSNQYKERQLVFVGANDGMLHAFKLGKLLQKWTTPVNKEWWQSAKLEGAVGAGGIGSESYAFIPKNTLPYLQYLQAEDYCHVYTVDGPTILTDASLNPIIDTTLTPAQQCTEAEYWKCPKMTTVKDGDVDFTKTSWRTTLIGSMGIGGATCDSVQPQRVEIPLSVDGKPVGKSSYFALDVTDQANPPKLLWEFSHADLGMTNIGAGIVKVGGNEKRCTSDNSTTCSLDNDCGTGQCLTTNGRWFAILASGPTGPISSLEFKGQSDQTLKLFILDLKTGELLRTIDTGIPRAFAGSISSNAIDLERSRPSDSGTYQDDAVYIGYVQDYEGKGQYTKGGVLRLVLNDDITPANWKWSKVFVDGEIGPVTTSVVNLLDRQTGTLWLYFGEGRFFYKTDDFDAQRKLFGVKEPCYDKTTNTLTESCINDTFKQLQLLDLKDQTTTPAATLATTDKGWFVNMAATSNLDGAERIISNPTPDALGAVFFLSFAPTKDICGFGGTTFLWALDYKTGGKVTYTLQGKALVQVSTGEIKELKLADAFTEEGGRKSQGFMGIPPAGQGVMVITSPSPLKKFMHVQEQ